MPELPEVETTRRGILPHVIDARISEVIVRNPHLRLPVSPDLDHIHGASVTGIDRRSKYLLARLSDTSTLLIHLGMSGSLRILSPAEEWKKHDHIALSLGNGTQLRYHDPRRFGMFLRLQGDPLLHPLLQHLGPEPLDASFTPDHLARACQSRKAAIKIAIMDAKVVVGVGNIYASESLYHAGIRPSTPAHRLSSKRISLLHEAIRKVLSDAIEQGGTTLRDFVHSDGQPGYFRQRLMVYGRDAKPCRHCTTPIRHAVMGQRSTYWCPSCQR